MKNLLIKNNFALRTVSFLVLLSISFSLLPLAARGQTTEPASRQLVIKEKTLGEAPRLALVIGNSKYVNMGQLKNPNADAVDMAAALRALGFEVLEGVDQSKKQMEKLILEFGDKLYRQKGIGLFFYAGHGVQSKGINYLIPVNADIPTESDIEYEAVDLGRLLARFDDADNELNIVILDACRNNPLAKEWSRYRSTQADDGLAKIKAPKGTILFYATEPGKAASDGAGRNGLFTESLLEHIKKPNLEFDALYKVVARSVTEKSKQIQRPYKEGNSFTDFYFAGNPANAGAVSVSPVVKANEAEPEIKTKDAAAVEKENWEVIKDSSNPQDFKDFLTDSPTGIYAVKARIRLEQSSWDLAKKSNDKAKIQSYLNEFPEGVNVRTAKALLRQLESKAIAETTKTEAETVEAVKSEPKNEEPAKTEAAEVAEEKPVKKVITPKAATRTASAKNKPAAGANKFEVRKNALGMELVYLPAASFMMGASEANVNESYALGRKDYKETERAWFDNEKPQHRVTFANGYWIGKTEVTQAQWKAVMGDNPSFFKDCDECPVERISWDDAKKFIEKLNAQNDGLEYRLPSEAEWEYAARGGKTGILAGKMDDMAWYNVNSEIKTHPVAMQQPNGFGLFDMHGNVAEWCEDTYSENYENAPTDGTANMNGNPDKRIVRGGYYNDFPTNMRLTRRDTDTPPKVRRSNNGLRVVAIEKQ